MNTAVTDASVVLKWVLREEEADVQSALALFQDFSEGAVDIVLPHLWLYEVANVLIQKTGLNETTESLHFLFAQDFRVAEFSKQSILRACEIAHRSKLTFYDACYHALAIQEGAVFITSDERYFRKAKIHKSILLLRDYRSAADLS